MAGLSYGGSGAIVFVLSMLLGMWAAPPVRNRLDSGAALT
jgi:hypothetical protein